MTAPCVAVIIPCFNQGAFLGEALRSVLDQSPKPDEVIVVDDGSTDDTAAVARSFPEVRYIRQQNRGSAGARNTGLAASTAEFVAFLDADDRFCPGAIESGVRELAAHPQCAFVYGSYHFLIMDDSSRTPVPRRDYDDAYAALLRENIVVMLATAMFRRAAIEEGGPFDETLKSCEDWDLYLRLARRWPIAAHDGVVAEYRRHASNKSTNPERLLRYASMVLEKQRPLVRPDQRRRRAYRAGVRNWQIWLLNRLTERARRAVSQRRWLDAARAVGRMLRTSPWTLATFFASAARRRLRR
jgi:glycosyltransferase involved in cell wall biosynthesis